MAGVTLMEMMISIAVGSVIIAAVSMLMWYNSRSMAAISNYADLDQDSRQTLDLLSREIRSATRITSYATNEIIFNTGGGTNNLRYFYNDRTSEFAQFKDGTRTPLLTGCESMYISIYGRNNISNQFSQFGTTNAANAKMVRFTWTCSRDILGAKVNTESVQSAKIVLRKQN